MRASWGKVGFVCIGSVLIAACRGSMDEGVIAIQPPSGGSGGAAIDASASGGNRQVYIAPIVCGELSMLGPDKDKDGYGVPSDPTLMLTALDCFFETRRTGKTGRIPDCDDTDANRYQIAFNDADGDRHGDLHSPVCVGLPWPEGASSTFDDCDDSDPTVNVLRIRDRDGDGYGGETACEPPGTIGTLSMDERRPSDCDETDPLISPIGVDVPGDGVDGNCDGVDGGNAELTGDGSVVGFNVNEEPVLPAECSALDGLELVEAEFLHSCSDKSPLFFRILNGGSEMSPPVSIVFDADSEWRVEFPVPALEPGAKTDFYATAPLHSRTYPYVPAWIRSEQCELAEWRRMFTDVCLTP